MTSKVTITTYSGGSAIEVAESSADGGQKTYILEPGATHELTVGGDRQITVSEMTNTHVIRSKSAGETVRRTISNDQLMDLVQRMPQNSVE